MALVCFKIEMLCNKSLKNNQLNCETKLAELGKAWQSPFALLTAGDRSAANPAPLGAQGRALQRFLRHPSSSHLQRKNVSAEKQQ